MVVDTDGCSQYDRNNVEHETVLEMVGEEKCSLDTVGQKLLD